MGLDISVYKEIDFDSFIADDEVDGEEKDDMYDTKLHLHVDSKEKDGGNWYGQSDDIKKGFYSYKDRETSFRAGSYSGYGRFRRVLCEFFYGFSPEIIWNNPDEYKGSPFAEIICFSDCDGTIGPKTSEKLYKDFRDNEEKFKAYLKEKLPTEVYSVDFLGESYNNWLEAFKIASNNGAVCFH